MTLDRRTFLLASAAVATGARLLGHTTLAPKPLRILILGGTGFLGPALVLAAQARGHKLTLFNRGKTRPGLFPDIEKRQGDRDPRKGEGLKSLETGEWDVVIDDSGHYPRHVKSSAELLAKRVRQYIHLSSISAYKEPNPVNGTEDAPTATLADPTVEEMGKEYQNYGGLKALSEAAAQAAMPGRTTIIRPGYIVGPDDYSGRFTYWPVRFDRGGEVAVPGTPEDPLQIIDVRDLAEWIIHLSEANITGVFNACGPEKPLRWGRVIDACVKGASKPATPVWIPTEFIVKQEGLDFPIWAPPVGDTKGFHTWSNARAMKAGLKFRTAEQTVKDTLAWYQTQLGVEKGRTKLAGPTPEQEAKAIADFRASLKPKVG